MDFQRRASIENLLARYSWAADECRFDEFGACFTSDATLRIESSEGVPSTVLRGRTAIVEWLTQLRRTQVGQQRRHMTSNLVIEENTTNVVRASSYVVVHIIERGKVSFGSIGWYVDKLVTEDGTWRIADRLVHLDCVPKS